MFTLRNRSLLIASSEDTESYNYFKNYRCFNSDRITLENILNKFTNVQGAAQYHSAYIFTSAPFLNSFLASSFLLNLYRIIQSGGNIFFHISLNDNDGDKKIAQLEEASLFSGYINPRVIKIDSGSQNSVLQYAMQRPTWDMGETSSIRNEMLIDDSLLLDEKEYVPLGEDTVDCATKPKACSNCTCGRKELEVQYGAEEAKKRLETGAERSSCGNCYLGDAFRCAGCPYKGQPAFKPGRDIIELDTTKDDLSYPIINEDVSLNDLTSVAQHT